MENHRRGVGGGHNLPQWPLPASAIGGDQISRSVGSHASSFVCPLYPCKPHVMRRSNSRAPLPPATPPPSATQPQNKTHTKKKERQRAFLYRGQAAIRLTVCLPCATYRAVSRLFRLRMAPWHFTADDHMISAEPRLIANLCSGRHGRAESVFLGGFDVAVVKSWIFSTEKLVIILFCWEISLAAMCAKSGSNAKLSV